MIRNGRARALHQFKPGHACRNSARFGVVHLNWRDDGRVHGTKSDAMRLARLGGGEQLAGTLQFTNLRNGALIGDGWLNIQPRARILQRFRQ